MLETNINRQTYCNFLSVVKKKSDGKTSYPICSPAIVSRNFLVKQVNLINNRSVPIITN